MVQDVQQVVEEVASCTAGDWVGWLALTAALAALAGWAGAAALRKVLVSLRRARIWREIQREHLIDPRALPARKFLPELEERAKVDPPGWVALLVGTSTLVGVLVGAVLGWRLEYDDPLVGAVVGLAAGLSPGWIVRKLKARASRTLEEGGS